MGTYHFWVALLRAGHFDIGELEDLDAAVFGSLFGGQTDFFHDNQFFEAARGTLQQQVAFLVVFAHYQADFSWKGKICGYEVPRQ